MIAVSDAWKLKQRERLAPEGFVEISYLVSEDGLQAEAVASSKDQAVFSDLDTITVIDANRRTPRYATMELNQWILDGTSPLLAENGPYENVGYASDTFCDSGDPLLTVDLPVVHAQPIQGITITWSTEHNEFATRFKVAAYRGSTAVATTTVTNNAAVISTVKLDMENYDSVVIQVFDWCLPYRRARIEQVVLGIYVTYTKAELTAYSHEQIGCLVAGELPKNSITFSLENSSGLWNPLNPDGYVRYLAERQQIRVRYGFDIDGHVEWIKAGTFYLSEWSTPSNGLTATFTARDMLEFIMDVPYSGIKAGTLYEIASAVVAEANLPYGAKVYIDSILQGVSTDFSADTSAYTQAEVLQMVANAGNCVLYQDRDGVLRVEPMKAALSGYNITENESYTYPEVTLSKPLKAVRVSYGEQSYTLNVAEVGEVQTIDNPLITTEVAASRAAKWVAPILQERQTISGTFRADPRVDVCDKVAVDSKYGVCNAVVITNIKYEFTGAFRGTYTGRVSKFDPVPAAYCGELYAGEV